MSRATRRVAAIGGNEPNAFAAEVLKLFDDTLSITQCTIFAYESGNRPRTMSVADHRDSSYLRDLADTYARYFYALDGDRQIVSTAHRDTRRHDLLLHQQAGDEIVTQRIARPATAAPTCPTGRRCRYSRTMRAGCRSTCTAHIAAARSIRAHHTFIRRPHDDRRPT
ncbi:hypothetical protein L2Y90_03335 [Burkholderia pyrrocinia]|uniref:hypothetical protein n=1 Tax=Burkholderia pyrrocinia TaxID=60550 RepID=UPI00215A8307|nr:hypothetical protein [Burkholderia pyrrocinia]UVE66175.1 hypothetical protein L2Y90_03335 [Burkholderia pyrrocinia]